MKNKEKKKEFRHSLRGYKKEDVNRYILSMDKTAKEDMLECRRNFQNQIAVWEAEKKELLDRNDAQSAELAKLQEENVSLKKANAEIVRKQEEQFVAFAQLVADITEMRKKLAAYESSDVQPAQTKEEIQESVPVAPQNDTRSGEFQSVPKAESVHKPKAPASIRFSYSVGKNSSVFPFKKNKN